MAEQQNIISSFDDEEAAVFLSKQMIGEVADACRFIPNGVMVLLVLVFNSDSDGDVEVSAKEVAQTCNLTVRKVRAAILGLAGAGLIESLELSSDLEGAVTCWVNPVSAYSNKS